MAERPPPPPLPADKGNGAKIWTPKSKSNPNPKGSIPIPTPAAGYGWMNPPPKSPLTTGYGPYGARACFAGVGPYGYGYQHVRPAQPQFLPQPQVNVNGFVENRDMEMGLVQGQTIVPGMVRRGTGVFHPPPPPPPVPIPYNNKSNKNIGRRNKQGAGVIHQTKRSRNASEGNDGLVKQEESHQLAPSSEIGLPKEWPY